MFDDGEEPIGFAVRKRSEHHRVHQAEDRRRRPGAERDGQDRHRSETGIPEQRPDAKSQVLPHGFQPSAGAHVVGELAHPAQIAEPPHRRVPCGVRHHPARDIGLGRQLDMRAHLLLDIVDGGFTSQ